MYDLNTSFSCLFGVKNYFWREFMSFLPILILSVTQGLLEFLPISSSGHLVVFGYFLNFRDHGLLLDVSMHLGSLSAVCLYFKNEILNILRGLPGLINEEKTENETLSLNVFLSSIPIIFIGGIIFLTGLADKLRNIEIIALSTIVFALLLYYADKDQLEKGKSIKELKSNEAILVGFAQVFSIIPGASRAGVVFTATRFLKFNRVESAKYAMIISIPVILVSSAIPIIELAREPVMQNIFYALIGFLISAFVAYFSIAVLLRFLQSYSMLPFVIYRIVFGTILLYISFN